MIIIIAAGGLGVYYLWRAGPEVTKEVFGAFSPLDGVDLLFTYQDNILGIYRIWGIASVGKMLSGIVLAVTGVEALYADLGHFSREAIQLSWLFVVWPCLLLQYIGQAAAILEEPARLESPSLRQPPGHRSLTCYHCITSGDYGVVFNRVAGCELSFLTTLRKVKHTSLKQEGEVYVPALNLFLGVCCVVVVLGFRTSANLTSAYGLAVTIDMALTTTFFTLWVHLVQGKSLSLALCFGIPFWCIDFLLISANVVKFLDGAWFPITTAFALGSVMAVWFTGRRWVYNSLGRSIGPKGPHQLKSFLDSLQEKGVVRMQATGVFFTPGGKPHVPISALQVLSLLHSFPRQAVFLHMTTIPTPFVRPPPGATYKVEVRKLSEGIFWATALLGYAQSNVEAVEMVNDILAQIDAKGAPIGKRKLEPLLNSFSESNVPSTEQPDAAL
eukprot:g4573.t1